MEDATVKIGGLDRETVLEIGLAMFAGLLLGGSAVLLFGRGVGGLRRVRGKAQGAPAAGSLPPQRHQNIAANPPR